MMRIRNHDRKIQKIVDDLYKAAIDYYGKQFQSEINDTIEKTIIYDMGRSSLKRSIQTILGDDVDVLLPHMNQISSFFLMNPSNYQSYVLCRGNQPVKTIENVLAHELYGHALFSIRHFLLRSKQATFIRNGFCLKPLEGGKELYPMWTEGCAVLAQEELLKRTNGSLQIADSYQVAYQGAQLLRKVVGKDALHEYLIRAKGNVISQFNTAMHPILEDAFQKIEELSMLHKEICLTKKYIPDCYQNQMTEIVNQYQKRQ